MLSTSVCSLELNGTTLSPMTKYKTEPINLHSLKSFRHGVWPCLGRSPEWMTEYRCQADSNFVTTCRLEETSGATSYYVDENSSKWKECSQQMQTLHTGCSNVEPKIFAPLQTPFPGAWDGQSLISWRLPLPTNPVWWGSMLARSVMTCRVFLNVNVP